MNRQDALDMVEQELDRYHTLWNRPDGDWPDHMDTKLRILVEEVGEVAKGLNEHDLENVAEELIQTASVCVAWLMANWDCTEIEIEDRHVVM